MKVEPLASNGASRARIAAYWLAVVLALLVRLLTGSGMRTLFVWGVEGASAAHFQNIPPLALRSRPGKKMKRVRERSGFRSPGRNIP